MNNETMEEITVKSLAKSNISNSIENKEFVEPHLLSEDGLLLYIKPEDKPFPPVPPSTPKELISDCYVTTLPEIPDSFKDINIPCVRECGIRDSLAALAKYFNCEDFKNNLVQFWFLDMLVDCIWRAQDEYKFALQNQKVLLEWILFILKLIKDPNMTKSLLFEIFNEALTIAENHVQSGGTKAPTPNSLFSLQLKKAEDVKDENAQYSFMSFLSHLEINSSEEFTNKPPPNQYVVVKLQESVQVFKVPNNEPLIEDCLSSSIDSPSEYDFASIFEPSESMKQEEPDESELSIDYYKPVMTTPPRFKSLQNIEVPKQDSESLEQKAEVESIKSILEWLNIPRNQTTPQCPSQIVRNKINLADIQPKDTPMGSSMKVKDPESLVSKTQVKESEKQLEEIEIVLDKEQLFKIFYDYNMWQLKNEYMGDPNIGWTPSLTSYKSIFKTKKLSNSKIKTALKNIKSKTDVEREKNIFVNMCVLMAVKQIVFEYFNYNFSFELVRTSLRYPQYLITQDINTFWNVPKEIKGEVKKPLPKKPKKEKPKKEKPPKGKKDKSSKKDKSTKGSKGKSKEKKGKDKKSKSDKTSKKSKKSEKDKKISKEEKKEMDRLRKEQEDIEKQKLKEQENKMFMFPLKEAVDDHFFMKLFPDFKSKKGGKKGDKKQDKKGDKGSKSGKSDKSSKKGKKKK